MSDTDFIVLERRGNNPRFTVSGVIDISVGEFLDLHTSQQQEAKIRQLVADKLDRFAKQIREGALLGRFGKPELLKDKR